MGDLRTRTLARAAALLANFPARPGGRRPLPGDRGTGSETWRYPLGDARDRAGLRILLAADDDRAVDADRGFDPVLHHARAHGGHAPAGRRAVALAQAQRRA